MNGYIKGFNDGIRARASFKHFVLSLYDGHDDVFGNFANDIKRDAEFPSRPYVDRYTKRELSLKETIESHLLLEPDEDGDYGRDIIWFLFNTLYNDWEAFCDGKPVVIRGTDDVPIYYWDMRSVKNAFGFDAMAKVIDYCYYHRGLGAKDIDIIKSEIRDR